MSGEQPELRPDQYLPWPWREMGELADHLNAELREGVTSLMRKFGEDPDNKALYHLRCVQVAYSVQATAERAREGR